MYSHEDRLAIKKLKLFGFTPKLPLKTFRNRIEEGFSVKFLPNRVDRREMTLNGILCDVLKPELSIKKRVVVYIHGGSYIAGSRSSWRNFCASLAHESASRIVVPEYRLAPEYPFPCGLEDTEAAYRFLSEKECDIVLAGDGSGAAMALALTHKILSANLPVPKALVLFSPWVQLTPDTTLFKNRKASDPVLTLEGLAAAAELYTYSGNMKNPLVSPLEDDFIGFPRIYVQAGSEELLGADVQAIAARAAEAGISCIQDVREGFWHLFQMADEHIACAHQAVADAGAFIRSL